MKTNYKISKVSLVLVLGTVLGMSPLLVAAQRLKHAPSASRTAPSRPSANQNKSINGGSQRSASRNISNNNNVGNKNNNLSGNKVNIDNSRKNVNVNIDNSRNTVVRRNNINSYHGSPYRYGGHRYYCHHAYFYHPYRPFYWGPVWHPWGFFIATLARTAIIISIANQQYHYDQGVYYVASSGGYTVVQAPVGATITTLPEKTETVVVNETTNNYYYGGTYYEKTDKGYTVVAPAAGTIVENLPEGGEEVKIGDQTYVKVGETYYQPTQKDGKNVYEVVQIEDDK